MFFCNNPERIQLLTTLRLGLSHLREFKYNVQDILDSICNCGEDIESSCHYILHCSLYINQRLVFLNVIQGIDNSILELGDSHIVDVFFHERKFLVGPSNTNILNATRKFFLKLKGSMIVKISGTLASYIFKFNFFL